MYLKPCHFCGGKALIDFEEPYGDSYRGVSVTCVKCCARITARKERRAAGLWNRRTGPRPWPGRGERC